MQLTQAKALIFRITHFDNVAWMISNGLRCRNSSTRHPNYREIGNPEIISRRATHKVPAGPGGVLSDYIPFYFTPLSPMLLNIRTGWNGLKVVPMKDIIIVATSLHRVQELGIPFVITDRHAVLAICEYSSDLTGLSAIDWDLLQARDFKYDAADPGKGERYQAEALIHQHLPIDGVKALICHNTARAEAVTNLLQSEGITANVLVKPSYFF